MLSYMFLRLAILLSSYALFSTAPVPECLNCGCCMNDTCSREYVSQVGGYVNDVCTKGCIDGISGRKCYNKCPNGCSTCEQYSRKTCTGCVPGYYLTSYKNCSVCSTNCKSCTSQTECQTCNSPYYNDDEITNCSLSCPMNCFCQSIGSCSSCKDGYYNISNGCQDVCPNNCVSCSSENTCHTCDDGFYNGKEFDDEAGYAIMNCSLPCRETCNNCTSYNSCQSCKQNFEGPSCDDCSPGWYGQKCNMTCLSSNCSEGRCDKSTGECISCPEGLYGLLCDQTCSPGCNKSCNFTTGSCFECSSTYSGDKCCVKDGHCLACSSNTVCDTCVNGFYGEVCNETCSEHCLNIRIDPICEKDNGFCNNCSDGFYGDYCNATCSSKCSNKRCFKENGVCAEGCDGNFEGPTCTQEVTSESDIIIPAVVGGSVGGLVIIIIVAVIIVVMKRRRPHAKHPEDLKDDTEQNNPKLPEEDEADDELENISEYGDREMPEVEEEHGEALYENVADIPASIFATYVKMKTNESYNTEFSQLPRGLTESHEDSKKTENVGKNRYVGVYPYDHSRVKIKSDPKFYINACFIDGFRTPNGYIAALGPTKKTTNKFNLFWTMVWHVNSDVIVMLTNLREQSGNKCDQYWPNLNCTNIHQDITVSCRSVQVFAEYTMRTFTIEKKKSEKRTVYQIHYTAWPDKSIPSDVTSVVEFRQRVRSIPRTTTGPVIVHCSAGVGRTGTYIALDRLTEVGEAGETINVFECVNQMRKHRVNMVQTPEQYKFIHKALVHTLTFNCGAIRAEEFSAYIRDTSDSEFKTNFELQNTVIDDESPEEIEARETNGSHSDKNRTGSDIPSDKHRPILYLGRTIESIDYINAVYVNGFKKKNQYIIAQSPLPETVFDFICLIYQENCYCVVSMEDPGLIGTEIGEYVGDVKHSFTCGCFTIKSSRCDSTPQYVLKKLIIINNDKDTPGEKVVYHYQLTNWKSTDDVPADVRQFTQCVKDVSNQAGEMLTEKAPILVHCLNGAKRSGLFCAVGILLERIEAEGQASVPNTVRRLRTYRRKAIPNKEQFEFCFRCIESHVESNNTYANFAQ